MLAAAVDPSGDPVGALTALYRRTAPTTPELVALSRCLRPL